MKISPRRMGFAFAVVAGLFYGGCILLMSIAGHEKLVFFFNGLFHGLDLSTILLPSVGLEVTITGFINTIILSWLFGAALAVAYNHSGWLDPSIEAKRQTRASAQTRD